MILDMPTGTATLVVQIDCPECNMISTVGVRMPQTTLREQKWGLCGMYNSDSNGEFSNFLHCPVCDYCLADSLEDPSKFVTDVTPLELST